jgi:hypothetical protein
MFDGSEKSLTNGLSPEWQLLVRCARTSLDAADRETINDLVRNGIDWDRLVALASRHRVTPLLCQSLCLACTPRVPLVSLGRLSQEFSLNVASNLGLTHELIRVLKLFKSHELSAIPFKGPTLAALAYTGLALRQAGDLDILVHPRNAKKARQLLISGGYRPYYQLTEDQEFEHACHFRLMKDGGPIVIEIHWQLMSDSLCLDLNEDRLWRNAAKIRLAGAIVPCFATEDLLLYLCVHGAKHCWHRISWVCDIAELVRVKPDLDWAVLTREARRIGAHRMLALGLLLAQEVLGRTTPAPVAREIRADATARELARQVIERYRQDADGEPATADSWRFNVRARERLRDRIRCRFKLALPVFKPNERDVAFVKLPPGLSFLYRGVKVVRLVRKYALHPLRFVLITRDLIDHRQGSGNLMNDAPSTAFDSPLRQSAERLHSRRK